jgi:hypothetical protein
MLRRCVTGLSASSPEISTHLLHITVSFYMSCIHPHLHRLTWRLWFASELANKLLQNSIQTRARSVCARKFKMVNKILETMWAWSEIRQSENRAIDKACVIPLQMTIASWVLRAVQPNERYWDVSQYVWVGAYMCACMFVCMCVWVHEWMNVCVPTWARECMHVCSAVCVWVCLCLMHSWTLALIHTCMHALMHTHACMYEYVHTCVCMCMNPSVCAYYGMHACMCEPEHVHTCIHVCVSVSMYVCMCVWVHACMYMYMSISKCMHVCVLVFVYVCMTACVCVCVCVCVCMLMYSQISRVYLALSANIKTQGDPQKTHIPWQ